MSRRNFDAASQIPNTNKVKHWAPANSDAYSLKVHEQTVMATIATGVTATLNMPNVVEAEGLTYSIFAVDGTGSVTVAAAGARDWSNLTVDATNDAVILKAQGGKWWALDNEIA